MREIIYAGIILALCIINAVVVLLACRSYRKWKKDESELEKYLNARQAVSSREMTPEELEEFLHTFNKEEDSEKDFIKWVQDYMSTDHSNDPIPKVEPIVEVVADCEGYDCACSPNREDCCHQFGKDGRCHFYINLNKVMGIDDVKRDPSILTPQEVNELANALEEYQKSQDSQNKAHN